MIDIDEARKIAGERTKGVWGYWCVTTAPQTCPDGIDRPLIHGAAPPHQLGTDLDVALGDDAVRKACADATFITYCANHFEALLDEVEAARAVAQMAATLRESMHDPQAPTTHSDVYSLRNWDVVALTDALKAYRAVVEKKK